QPQHDGASNTQLEVEREGRLSDAARHRGARSVSADIDAAPFEKSIAAVGLDPSGDSRRAGEARRERDAALGAPFARARLERAQFGVKCRVAAAAAGDEPGLDDHAG